MDGRQRPYGNVPMPMGFGQLSHGNFPTPIGDIPMPMVVGQLSYGNVPMPMGVGQLSYGNIPMPFGSVPMPMGVGQLPYGNGPMPMGGGQFVTVTSSSEYVDSTGGLVVMETTTEQMVGEMYLDCNGLPVQNLTSQGSAFDPSRGPAFLIGGNHLALPCCNANRQLEYGKSTNSNVQITELEDSRSGFGQHSHIKDTHNSSGSRFGLYSHNKASEGTRFYSFSSKPSSLLELSSEDIHRATNGLSGSLKIGEGGYGNVYEGLLGNTKVAIKILDPSRGQGQSEFDKELEVLNGLKHPNLVTLLGASFRDRALVYEFLCNGSLEDFLRSKDKSRLLTWQIRILILSGICKALIFLHSKSIIHGDLKPANILLDDKFNSKLGDFGLCRFLPKGSTHRNTKVFGTPGYMDPVFMQTGNLTTSSDLYAFGVTIMRLVTGMEAIGIVMKVHNSYTDSSMKITIDPTAGNWPLDLAQRMTYWGLRCCHDNKKSSELLEEIRRGLQG